MITQNESTKEAFEQSLKAIFDAIPKGKRFPLMREMMIVEVAPQRAYRMLEALRKYNLDNVGEESPFVKEIDTIMKRK